MIGSKILTLIKAFLAFGFLSTINAILIRIAILSSSVVVFPLLSCTRSILRAAMTNFQVAAVYRASPHIGAPAAYLDRRGTSKWNLIGSFMMCLLCFYFMYASSYFMWTTVVFPSIIARGINDLYFFYINLLEFASLFFIRTRSTIKYLPKYLMLMNLIFIFYVNSYFYAAQYELIWILILGSYALFFYFLINYEIPAATTWNPFGNYTPSFVNPRAAYHIVQTDSFMMSFDIFSMFSALRFRESFT